MMKKKQHTGHLLALQRAGRLLYALFKLLPVQQKVVMISRFHRKTSIDFSMLHREIQAQHPNTKVVILNHRMDSKLKHAIDVVAEMYHLATSRATVVDSYVIPVSIFKHRDNLVIIQIWHALGAIKQFGHMTLGKRGGHTPELAAAMSMHRNYSLIACGGEATAPIFAKAFGVDTGMIKPIGMPRVDYLLDTDKRAVNMAMIQDKYPILRDREVILYAPTFRRHGNIAPQKLIEHIDFSRYALVIKQHTLDNTQIKPHDGVVLIGDEIDVLDLLSVSDHVITDYSAIAFEAALVGKKLYFWNYDYDTYERDCGLALDYYKEMPGVISGDVREIIRAIESKSFERSAIRRFANKYVNVQDGSCTARIVGELGL